MKRNVLFVVDEKRMGGVSVLLEDILNMINIKNYSIDVLVLHNNGSMLNNLPKDVNIIYGTSYFEAIDYTLKETLKSGDFRRIYHKIKVILDMKTGNIKNTIIRERKKILNKNYDVEIAFKDGFTALFTIFGNSKTKIHWLHYEYKKTNPNAKYDKLFKRILPKFDKIIAVSEGVEQAFNKIYHLENKTSIIPNLVNTDKIIKKSKEKSDVILSKSDINFVSVGRLNKSKGYDRLIEAIHHLKQKKILPDKFLLRIYGGGEEKEILNDLIRKYKLDKYIYLMGQVDNPYKYIKSNDMFVLSSNFESFGLVIVEAMILGVPVLATQNNATNVLIKDKYNGLIIENSTLGLEKGIEYVINNKECIKKYKKNLKEYKYDNSAIIKSIEGVLMND